MAHDTAKQAQEQQSIGIRTDMYERSATHKAKKVSEEKIMNKWQQNWNQEKTGRELYKFCKLVGSDKINLSFKGMNLMTGHGNMKNYLKKFNLKEIDGNCDCSMKEKEDVDHIMKRCDKLERRQARQKIRAKYGDLRIGLRAQEKVTQREVEKVNEWAENALTQKKNKVEQARKAHK